MPLDAGGSCEWCATVRPLTLYSKLRTEKRRKALFCYQAQGETRLLIQVFGEQQLGKELLVGFHDQQLIDRFQTGLANFFASCQ